MKNIVSKINKIIIVLIISCIFVTPVSAHDTVWEQEVKINDKTVIYSLSLNKTLTDKADKILSDKNEIRITVSECTAYYSFQYDNNESDVSKDVETLYEIFKKSGLKNFSLHTAPDGNKYLLSKEKKNNYYNVMYDIGEHIQLHIMIYPSNKKYFDMIEKEIEDFVPLREQISEKEYDNNEGE